MGNARFEKFHVIFNKSVLKMSAGKGSVIPEDFVVVIISQLEIGTVLCERNHHKLPSDDTELFVMKFSGVLLVVLGFVLAAVNYISLSQNIAAKHGEIIMITIAAYTFYKITMAIKYCSTRHRKSGQEVKASCPLFAVSFPPAVKLVCFPSFLTGGWRLAAAPFPHSADIRWMSTWVIVSSEETGMNS